MDTQTLKTKIINSVNKIDDIEYLTELDEIIEHRNEVTILSDLQEELINLSLEEIKRGEFITNEEMEKNDKWLKG